MTLLTEMEQERRETLVLSRLKRQAKQEEELGYEAWRTSQCKQIIVENRKLREAKYDKRAELDTKTAVFKEKQALEAMVEQMNREIETSLSRDGLIRQKDEDNRKTEVETMVRDTVLQICDIAFEAFQHK
jgi:hypothetical protein